MTVCGQDTEKIKEILRIRLSKKRYTHSLNVADMAVKLAEKYGGDADRAYLAGLVHDICKETPTEEQLAMARKCGRNFTAVEEKIPPLYHSAAGAYYCEFILNIRDSEILDAVRYHTTGRAGMCLLEEIIYMADLVSVERTYSDAEKMRRLAFRSLDAAMLEATKFNITDVVEKGSLIPSSTAEAYNYYTEKYGKGV